MFTTSILKAGTKRQLFVKNVHVFSNIWILLVNCPKKKQIIALQRLSKIIRISIQLWKWMPTLVNKECTQKIGIIFKFTSIFCMLYLDPNLFLQWNYILDYFIMLSKISSIFSSFHLSSFFSLLVYLCLFVNDGRSFYFFCFGYGHEKHKSYKYLVSMFIYGGLTFKV